MPVTFVIIGAGSRGMTYSQYAKHYPDDMQIVGVADCRTLRAQRAQKTFNIPDSHVFSDWRDVAAVEKFADAAIIATQDKDHKEPAVALAKKGYHILLEKPMATTEEDCLEIVSCCKENSVLLAVCHVLKYTPQAMKIKELIDCGAIGQVVNIQHLEPIGFWHYGHSYVRGNWRREDESSFCLMTKSCHDLDLICYWMGRSKCVKVSSFGQLTHFTKEHKPEGAANRCLDCKVEKECPYSAVKLYLNQVKQGNTHWPVDVVVDIPDIESVTEALRTGPYGRCVYDCDNDVVTHQVVNLQFDQGQTVSFTMVAFTESVCRREVKVHGTMGELTCKFGGPVYQYDFRTRKMITHSPELSNAPAGLSGHGGADYRTIRSFLKALQTGDSSLLSTGPEESLRSHLLVFAAEKARKENRVISLSL
ncbi:putative oxidoreductase YteT [Liolophura sinensis]|uniref:putative oxidoreductase YteT n=1 Tax=Liolophura sinensis TaxID=3198878 RepID=UPI003158C421